MTMQFGWFERYAPLAFPIERVFIGVSFQHCRF